MTRSGHLRRRRAASLLVLLHAAYVLVMVWLVTHAVWQIARDVPPDEPAGWFLRLMALGPLLIAVAVASPVLAWLVVLAVHLWRGRRWARTAGIVTFGVIAVALVVSAVDAGMTLRTAGLLAVATAPSVAGLALLLTGAEAFTPRAAAPLPTEVAG